MPFFYIETMIRTGFAGLVALIALTAGLLRALWRTPARDAGLLGTGVLPALLAMQLVWCLTWVPGSEQGIVTGLAIAVAAAQASGRNRYARPISPTAGREPTPQQDRPRHDAELVHTRRVERQGALGARVHRLGEQTVVPPIG